MGLQHYTQDVSRIPLKSHNFNVLHKIYTPCANLQGDRHTHTHTENIYSIFRDKLLLLGEHIQYFSDTNNAYKKVLTALLLSKLAKPTKPLHQPSLSHASDVKSKIVALLHTSDSVTASHTMLSNNSIIVQGSRKKKCILMAYQDEFGSEYVDSLES